ncbi:protein-tyrosine phosphatase-like protein [Microdochium trichocladiopsis]|uniref:Protein-tyrosine phosphatase-like protein n=1 Tax=Microdochium trichocladiopsis TaxID=1682393 RepID=A0A9P8Y488_9PEZI|nr:protein-tyrosine phosphatase-like protein [Microdochium trichocladiopsis]KAH7029433.1 protein-tyrosine phosphatase-like protein [Microdochium trichocladiopsis]
MCSAQRLVCSVVSGARFQDSVPIHDPLARGKEERRKGGTAHSHLPPARTIMPSTPAPDLPRPPFIHVDGLPNFRDAGGYPVTDGSSTGTGGKKTIVRRGVLYRASEPSKLSSEGEAQLRALGIREVYDLRSAVEIERGIREGHGWAIREWEGARRNFVPVFLDQDYSPEALALRIKNYSDETTAGFVKAYMDILHAASDKNNQFSPFRTILAHLAAPPAASSSSTQTPSTSSSSSSPSLPASTSVPVNPPATPAAAAAAAAAGPQQTSGPPPVLIHCTAGKDRTGVICALVLSLCGVADHVIADEYNLTELGLRERHEELMQHLLNNPSMAGNVAGVRRMIGAQKPSMLGTLALIREKYGSIHDCVVKLGLLSPDEIIQLRDNLVVDANDDDVDEEVLPLPLPFPLPGGDAATTLV